MDKRTENELKIGVSVGNAFNMDSAFCDLETGFAYYSLGSLRHGSNSQGVNYGSKFKNEGICGICLNMIKGTLSFSLNGLFLGIAYTDNKLKQGPVYAAVALLHHAGFTLNSGLPIPQCFLK